MTKSKLFGISIFLFILAVYVYTAVPKAVAANTCAVNVESTDAMQFNTKRIEISKSCEEFVVNLEHTGKMPKTMMGHNLVITKAADEKPVLTDATKAGAEGDYLKANDKRVLMATTIIGGGESTTAKLNVSQLKVGEDYVFFCTFPGHSFMMRGSVKLV